MYSLLYFSEDIESFIEEYSIRHTCILRSFCRKAGLQITMREYQFESPSKTSRSNQECFHENDILNIYPVIKHAPPKVKLYSFINKLLY